MPTLSYYGEYRGLEIAVRDVSNLKVDVTVMSVKDKESSLMEMPAQ